MLIMLAEHYSYTITETPEGMVTVLTKGSDGRSKTFFQACHGEPARQSLISHMETLTDENCDGFFPAERKKKEKPPKA
jgi:hypothetical protein